MLRQADQNDAGPIGEIEAIDLAGLRAATGHRFQIIHDHAISHTDNPVIRRLLDEGAQLFDHPICAVIDGLTGIDRRRRCRVGHLIFVDRIDIAVGLIRALAGLNARRKAAADLAPMLTDSPTGGRND